MNQVDLGKLKVDRTAAATPRTVTRRRFKAWHLVLVAAAIGLAWFLFAPSVVPAQVTRVVTAWPSQQYVLLDATGYVVARRKAAVASKGTGRVEWLGVSEGEFVKAGTVVARLESQDVDAAYRASAANSQVAMAGVTSAETELADADLNLQRMTRLYAKGLVAQVTVSDAQSRYRRAQSAVSSARSSLTAARANQDNARSTVDYTAIRAPFDGVVISRSANIGDIVTPLSSAADAKGAVLIMADMSTLQVDADVSESALASVSVGQPCEIALDAFPNRRFRGEVDAIVPTVNRASATVTTKVRILDRDARILPDMSARVSFLSKPVPAEAREPVLAVNPQALVKRDGATVVYRIGEDGKAVAVKVTAGARLGDVRQVSGQLKAGEALVLSPGDKVSDGTMLKLPEAP